jgi:hypothetical protein
MNFLENRGCEELFIALRYSRYGSIQYQHINLDAKRRILYKFPQGFFISVSLKNSRLPQTAAIYLRVVRRTTNKSSTRTVNAVRTETLQDNVSSE